MESVRPSTESSAERDSARENQGAAATLRMRLWAYGSQQKLSDLTLTEDKPVAELVRNVIAESHGTISEEQRNVVNARFDDPLHALSAAKSLQVRLLTLHREPLANQVVAAIIVNGESAAGAAGTSDPSTRVIAGSQMLAEANSAQILVSEAVYELARNVTGFDFKPVREASETGSSEAIYELRWTDESTYGHLRKTSQNPVAETPRERRYKIESELGRGCMGVVYKAYDQVIGRAMALKTIAVSRNFPNREVLIDRLKQEAKTAGGLDHPNIITIYDVGQEDDLIYLSMQLIEGKTLAQVIAEGTLPPLFELLSYAEQICNAVGYAHKKGVIHRDLKPANFMLTSYGTIKILDFGIAKIEDASLTQSGMIVGTPTYMAPEQARGKNVDQRSDIFSLGSVFYELFSRQKPFKGDITTILYKLIHEDPIPPAVINPALPPGIDAIVRKALAKNPKDRFQSCEEMREAFREQAVLLRNSATAPGTGSKPAVPAQSNSVRPVTIEDLLAEVQPHRSRAWIWAAVVLCILGGLGGATTWAFRVKAKTGSFPPIVHKVLAVFHGPKTDANTSEQQTAVQPSTSAPASEPKGTENSSSGSSGADQQNPTPNASNPDTAPSTSPTQLVNSASDQIKAQSSSESVDSRPVANDSTSSESSAEPQPPERSPFEPLTRKPKPVASSATKESAVKVEGFTRRDVAMLLEKADAATGRGDYALARYEYDIILRLDRRNATARAGLRRVIAAQTEQRQH